MAGDKFGGLLNSLAKKFDEKSNVFVRQPGDIGASSYVPFGIPTQIAELDLAMGRPGLPVGRVAEFFGFEASGKSTLAYHLISEVQKRGGVAALVDTEHTYDPVRLRQIGADPDHAFVLLDCDTLEGVFRAIDSFIDTLAEESIDAPAVIVVDSVTGAPPEAERERDIADSSGLGLEARIIKKGLRHINPRIAKHKILLVFVNHSISAPSSFKFAKQSRAGGGHAIKFFASFRCELITIGQIKHKTTKERYGQETLIRIEKLKGSALTWTEVEVALMNDNGFDINASLLNAMMKIGLIEHKEKSKDYLLVSSGKSFPRADWNFVLEDLGGFRTVYYDFLERAIELGFMKPWSAGSIFER